MKDILFQNWSDLGRILIVGASAYAGLMLLLRISGKRTLAKMNAFDLVVTIALGSTFATILLSKDVALVEGLLALALLVGLQFIVAWLAVRSQLVRRMVKADPRLLVYRGEYLERQMRDERVNRDEVLAAIRAQGIAKLENVGAVVLETDGSMTVTEGSQLGGLSALHDVEGVPDDSNAIHKPGEQWT